MVRRGKRTVWVGRQGGGVVGGRHAKKRPGASRKDEGGCGVKYGGEGREGGCRGRGDNKIQERLRIAILLRGASGGSEG